MLAITNARLLTVSNGIINDGDVLCDGNKILAVGQGIAIPPEAQRFDARGLTVTPGLIDTHSHISIRNMPASLLEASDQNEATDPLTPQLRAIDAVDPSDKAIEMARRAGFTAVCILPGSSNIIGGTGIVVKTRSAVTVMELAIPHSGQMKFSLGEKPRATYGQQLRMPATRMGLASILRETLYAARAYAQTLDGDGPRPPFNAKLQALVPVMRREMICRINCHRADDIVTAIRIADEFGLRYALEHATEGYKVLDLLKEKNAACVLGPLNSGLDRMELWGYRMDTPARFEAHGLDFCFTQDGTTNTGMLPVYIGWCIARGVSPECALRSITLNPARLLGLEKSMGSLDAGKSADMAIFNGDPFSNFTRCMATVIDGRLYRND